MHPLGTIVHGTITSVTPRMDTALRNVKMTPKGQDVVSLDTMNIRGSTIRYYILVRYLGAGVRLYSLLTPCSKLSLTRYLLIRC